MCSIEILSFGVFSKSAQPTFLCRLSERSSNSYSYRKYRNPGQS